MYVCMYVFTYVHMYVRMYVCTYVRMYVCMYVCECVVSKYVRMSYCLFVDPSAHPIVLNQIFMTNLSLFISFKGLLALYPTRKNFQKPSNVVLTLL